MCKQLLHLGCWLLGHPLVDRVYLHDVDGGHGWVDWCRCGRRGKVMVRYWGG
jgi:hypothetical protein